jgi:hypothetical protein
MQQLRETLGWIKPISKAYILYKNITFWNDRNGEQIWGCHGLGFWDLWVAGNGAAERWVWLKGAAWGICSAVELLDILTVMLDMW